MQEKIRSVYERIVSARLALNQAEVRFLAGSEAGSPDTAPQQTWHSAARQTSGRVWC